MKSGRIAKWADAGEAVPAQYLEGLRRAGALAVIAGGGPDDAEALVARVDGLMLIGGADVDPARYGEDPHPTVYGLDPARDAYELALVEASMRLGVPLLAICRGIQVLNVACGGTLWQHLPDRGGLPHGAPPDDPVGARHDVRIEPGSRLHVLAGGVNTLAGCPSVHHQASRQVGEGLVVTAQSEDGVIEALETPPDGPWCVGIQWHPERTAPVDPAQQALFDGFAAVCRSPAPAR